MNAENDIDKGGAVVYLCIEIRKEFFDMMERMSHSD